MNRKPSCQIISCFSMDKQCFAAQYMMILAMLSLSVAFCSPVLESHSCNHRIPSSLDVVHDVEIEPAHLVHKRSIDARLRIHLHYDSSINRLPAEHQALIKEKVLAAVAYWEDTLQIRETQAPIKLNRQCESTTVRYVNGRRYCYNRCARVTMCGDVVVPPEHLQSCYIYNNYTNSLYTSPDAGPGVAGKDFILYVAAIASERCQLERTVAFAAHCQQESALDRPVAGYFSLCPKSISTSHHDQDQMLSTLKHEILHALGFTAGLYAFYRDKYGRPLTVRNPITNKPVYDASYGLYRWSTAVARPITRTDWRLKGQIVHKTSNFIVTPNVVREVRSHFDCPTLEGAELEDQGIEGTNLTHWEKRVFENEAMTGTYTQNPVFSRITLALMEDTGWYKVKYENADPFEWGKGLGCDFVKKSCYEWMETRMARRESIHPFCVQKKSDRETITDCTNDRQSVAICNLAQYETDLPPHYQYFRHIDGVPDSNVGRYGGSVSLADYCPYLVEFFWEQNDQKIRGSKCTKASNGLAPSQNFLGELYSHRSKCFNHNSRWTLLHCANSFNPHYGSGCYQYDCSSRTGLTVFVGQTGYRCSREGQVIPLSFTDDYWLHRGSIICPSCTEVCKDLGITCPADSSIEITYTVDTQTNVPCRAAALYQSTSNMFGIPQSLPFILANVLCFLFIYLCHR